VDPETAELRAEMSERLRKHAARRKVSLEALADLAGVSRSHMWRVLRCECSPSIDWLGKVARALECAPRDLLP
jgi:transcriptional regulator with XRE-family HTH domain